MPLGPSRWPTNPVPHLPTPWYFVPRRSPQWPLTLIYSEPSARIIPAMLATTVLLLLGNPVRKRCLTGVQTVNLIPPGLTTMNPSLSGRPPQSREAMTVPSFIDPFRFAVLVISTRGVPVRLITNILPATAPLSVIGRLKAALRNPPSARTESTGMTRGPVPGILTLTAFPFGTGVTTWTFSVERSRVTLLLRPWTPETCIFLVGATLHKATAGFISVPTESTLTLKSCSIPTTWPPPVPRLLTLTLGLLPRHAPSKLRAGKWQNLRLRCGPHGRDMLFWQVRLLLPALPSILNVGLLLLPLKLLLRVGPILKGRPPLLLLLALTGRLTICLGVGLLPITIPLGLLPIGLVVPLGLLRGALLLLPPRPGPWRA